MQESIPRSVRKPARNSVRWIPPENHHWLVNERGTVMGATAPAARRCSACPPCATGMRSSKEKSSIKMEVSTD
jgi:hypothetical protein